MVSSSKRSEIILSKLSTLNSISCRDGLFQLLQRLKIDVKEIFEKKRSLIMILFVPKLQDFNELSIKSKNIDRPFKDNIKDNVQLPLNNITDKAKEFCVTNKLDCDSSKVFVNNIDFKVKQRELWDFFEHFGKVLRCSIIKERKTKRSRGFAFIIFSSPLDAKRAITAKNYELRLNGRLMTVESSSGRRKLAKVKKCWSSEAEEKIKEATEYFTNVEHTEREQSACTDEGIQNLCDELIVHIFSFLDLVTRVRIELVCTKWRNLSIESWGTVKHIHFRNIFDMNHKYAALTDRILISLLKKGCSRIKSIDLSASPFLISHCSLLVLGSICKELEELNLSQVSVQNKTLKILGVKLINLKKIQLVHCLSIGEKGTNQSTGSALTLLNSMHEEDTNCQCLYMLPKSIRSVDLNLCQRLCDVGLNNLASRCPNLTSLDLSFCISITDIGLKTLFESCIDIVDFKLKGASSSVTSNGLQHLKHLKKLISLDISRNNSVNDDIINLLSVFCKRIRFLNLEACHGEITCAGIKKLSFYDNLEMLNISYIVTVCDECLSELSLHHKLKTLIARSCCSFTYTGVAQCVFYLEKLVHFDISGCYSVTNSLIPLMQQINREPVTIILGGTEVTEEGFKDVLLPWCDVKFQNFNVGMLRNDRDPTLIGPFYSDDEEEEEDEGEDDTILRTWPDETNFDINEEYPNVDEDGYPLWVVETLAVDNSDDLLPVDEGDALQDENCEQDAPNELTSYPQCTSKNTQATVAEEDWESEMDEEREWITPIEYLDENTDNGAESDDFLQYDTPYRNEIIG